MKTRRIVAAFALLMIAVSNGCTSPTGPCESTRDVVGNWRYAAVVQVPVRATLTGTMSVTQQSCGIFSGSLNVVEVTSTGITRQRSGPMNGKTLRKMSRSVFGFPMECEYSTPVAFWSSMFFTDGPPLITTTGLRSR